MTQTLLIKKRQDGKPQFLQVDLKDSTVTREYGIVGGAVHGTSHTYQGVNIGKINEKTPNKVAEEDYHRLIETKTKEGYVVTKSLEEQDISILDQEKPFDLNNIPESFCISKPIKEITSSSIDKILETGNAKFFVKYNGIGHYILIKPEGGISIYTRRWCDHTIKYPEIVDDIAKQRWPKGTLLYCEFCIDPSLKIPHMTAFLHMSQISKADVVNGVCKEKVPKTLAIQKEYRVRAALLYILYCDNRPAYNYPLQINLNSLQTKAQALTEGKAVFVPKEVPITSGPYAMKLVKENKDKIEGLILLDLSAQIEVTFNGKPNRCAAWKIKSRGDADVIADGYIEGKGKFQGQIGALKICQYDSNNNRVDLGSVGGLSDKDRDPDSWKFPCVVEIKYDQRFPDTGKFQFPRFSKLHEDKVITDIEHFNY